MKSDKRTMREAGQNVQEENPRRVEMVDTNDERWESVQKKRRLVSVGGSGQCRDHLNTLTIEPLLLISSSRL